MSKTARFNLGQHLTRVSARVNVALDKLIPPIQIYLEDGKLFKEKNFSLEDVIEIKKGKIDLSPMINKYWQELLQELTRNKKKLFLK